MAMTYEAQEYADGSCAISWTDIGWYESPPEADPSYGYPPINLIMHPLRDGTIKPEDFKYKCHGEDYDDWEDLGTYEGWEAHADADLVRYLSIYIDHKTDSKELVI